MRLRYINDAIEDYMSSKPVRFHTPGIRDALYSEPLFGSAAYDVTELSGLDNLLFGNGAIERSERAAAEYFGTEGSLYFTSGATTAIFAAASSVRAEGDTLVAAGDCHRSVMNAAELFCFKTIRLESLDDAMPKNKKIAAVIITSPDYLGRCKDIKKAVNTAHSLNAKLIVDQSHGAHFCYSGRLPKSAVGIADFVIDSCHKTMPVFTGGAMLHCGTLGGAGELRLRAKLARSRIHTTSPNYMILASLERAIDMLAREGESLYGKLFDRIRSFKRTLCGTDIGVTKNDDFSRLVIESKSMCVDELTAKLEERGIYAEAVIDGKVVFLTSPYDIGAIDRLEEAVADISSSFCGDKKTGVEESAFFCRPARDRIAPVRRTGLDSVEFIDIENGLGRVLAIDIGLYPPGVPLFCRGDILDNRAVDFLMKNRERLFGLIENKLIAQSFVSRKGDG